MDKRYIRSKGIRPVMHGSPLDREGQVSFETVNGQKYMLLYTDATKYRIPLLARNEEYAAGGGGTSDLDILEVEVFL